MNDGMDHHKAGFTADPAALDHYIGQIVNPALENFEAIARRLIETTSASHATMLGHENLAGSTEFTGSCRRMLDTFFAAHRTLTDKQRALVQTVTQFRDNLQASSAAYARNEAEKAESIGYLSRQLETRLPSDGATG